MDQHQSSDLFEIVSVKCNKKEHKELDQDIQALCLRKECNKSSALCFKCLMELHTECNGSIKMLGDILKIFLPYRDILSKLEYYLQHMNISENTKELILQIKNTLDPISQYQVNQGLRNLNQLGAFLKINNITAIMLQLDQVEQEIQNESKLSKQKLDQAFEQQVVDLCDKLKAEEALQIIQEKIDNTKDNKIFLNLKGYALNALGKYKEAIECFNQTIKIDDQYVKALFNKGYSLSQLFRYDEAINCFEQTVKIDSKCIQALIGLGSALHKASRCPEAIECFDKAININQNSEIAYNHKGLSLSQLKKDKEAIQCYDQAIKINPDYYNAYNNKGFSLNKLDEYQKALECYDKAIKINPNSFYAYNNKGYLLNNLSRHKEAAECLQKAVQIDPQNEMAQLQFQFAKEEAEAEAKLQQK